MSSNTTPAPAVQAEQNKHDRVVAMAGEMARRFETHTGVSWIASDWRHESALWAAAWNAALSVQPVPDAESLAIKALRYWRDECSGGEPSISVFSRMVDEAIASQGASPAATACSASTLGVPASPSIPNADTERLDFMQRTQQTPWRCTEQRRVPSTRGMFDWRIHEEFLGWSANGSDADLRPTIREAIDVAMSAASGTRPEQTAQLPQAEPSDAELLKALSGLYHALPNVLPAPASERFNRTGRWQMANTGTPGGFTGTLTFRVEDIAIVYAAMDAARAALKQQEQR